MHTSLTR